jgi:cytochrome c biogenesis protein CcdA/thiol-disulfide isomerase/thioredoxin
MLIALLAYLGGMLTIVSPCILPVLPFVFANAGRSFKRGAVPMLAGMALTFAVVATLAAVGGSWAARANEAGRWVALVLLALFGLALVFPAISDRATRPLVAVGSRLSNRTGEESIWSSLVLGIATGLLWAPCAGPILGIIFTAAAIQGATLGTTFLLLAYALGAATSLALALLVGGRVFQRMKDSLHATEWVRRVLGVLVIVGVVAIALGLDTRVLSKLSSTQTASLETGLAQKLGLGRSEQKGPMVGTGGQLMLPVEGSLPSLDGLGPWINSRPLSMKDLKGKVVVIDFWTYSCINCIRSIPYVRAWYERYRDDGLVVIGVHAPEFAFERDPENVIQAVQDLDIRYPVALDNDYAVWKALKNNYWPAHYFFDAQGRQRYHHFGEGRYQESEMVIRQLLAEAGHAPKAGGMAATTTRGAEAGAAFATLNSPETYLGFKRADRFASPGGQVPNRPKTYASAPLSLNQWSLEGQWVVGPQSTRATATPAAIAYRFHARDVHLVLGSTTGLPVRFRVTIDGKAPGLDAGVDVKPDGTGEVSGQRLYQLVRQKGDVRDRTFRIEFLEPGVEAFAFTFG